MKKKALTKRQVLNELLIVEERKCKHDESQTRLYRRGEKLDDMRSDLVTQLEKLCIKEQVKEGDTHPEQSIKGPILYKKHVFTLVRNTYGFGRHLTIEAIKTIK